MRTRGVLRCTATSVAVSIVAALLSFAASVPAHATFPGTNGVIAYDSNEVPGDGFLQIFTRHADGSSRTQLTSSTDNNSEPSWSSDGKKIAFVSTRDGVGPEIYTMNADGSSQTRITNNTSQDLQPSFSADGSQIVFDSDRDTSGTGGDFHHQIYVMSSSGGTATRLTNNALNERQASFSPDGTQIVFERQPGGGNPSEIWTMDANGGNQTMRHAGGYDPAWAPDGKITYVSSADFSGHVFEMDANGQNPTELTPDLIAPDGAAYEEPSLSPDGTMLTYQFGNHSFIGTSSKDGTSATTFSTGGDWGEYPSWQPIVPEVDSITPASRGQGACNQAVTINGKNFLSGATVDFGNGITASGISVIAGGTQITLTICISSSAPIGTRKVTVTNTNLGRGSCSCFTVTSAPTITSFSPSSLPQGASNQSVTLNGTNLQNGANVSFSGSGVTVNSVAFVSSTQLTLNVSVDAVAAATARNATVTDPDAGAGSCTSCFTIIAARVLSVTLAGNGAGSVSDGGALHCSSSCTNGYADGSSVTLTATPSGASTFAGWSGVCSGTGSCTLTMDASKSVTATFTLPAYRPDALEKSAKDTAFLGDNIYNTDGTNQTSTLRVLLGRKATFQLSFQNDGATADPFTIKGCAPARGFIVQYFDASSVNVTAAVRAGTYAPGTVASNGSTALTLVIKGGLHGRAMTCRTTVTSGGDASTDVVGAIVRVL